MIKMLYNTFSQAHCWDLPSLRAQGVIFPEHVEPLRSKGVKNAPFPEHVEPVENLSVPGSLEYTRFFLSMRSHFSQKNLHLCLSVTKSKGIMAGKLKEMNTIKQVLLLSETGISARKIAKSLRTGRNTVLKYLGIVKREGWRVKDLVQMEDPELEKKFSAGSPAYTDERMETFLAELPTYERELSRKHVTRYLVWQEYKARHPDGYSKSQFFYHLRQNLVAKPKATAVLSDTYVPGNILYVDYAGDKLSYIDTTTGEIVKVETFVATLPYSDYAFAYCVDSQRTEDFLHALRMCLEHIGGVPRIVVPDNLKAAVRRADRYEPEINRAMEDMGGFYNFAVMPCQPYSPTQKALVENQVRLVYRRIYAKLRDRAFYSLRELNGSVEELLTEHNRTRMQKRPYSREERFFSAEKASLQPLPEGEYEMKSYAHPKVQQNGHIEIRHDTQAYYYSVPYQYIGKQSTAIITRSTVKIYVDNVCVATHLRGGGGRRYVTEMSHLASRNRIQLEKCPEYYIDRASAHSEAFGRYVRAIFSRERTSAPPELSYRTCDMLLSLSRRYDHDAFESTCEKCMSHNVYRGTSFENILKSAVLLAGDGERTESVVPDPTGHANMRGKEYYSNNK